MVRIFFKIRRKLINRFIPYEMQFAREKFIRLWEKSSYTTQREMTLQLFDRLALSEKGLEGVDKR